MALPNVKFGASSRIQHAGIICRATVAFFTWQGLRVVRRHSRAGTPRRVRIVVVPIELNNERAAMKDFSGSIRTSIQRQSGGQVVAA